MPKSRLTLEGEPLAPGGPDPGSPSEVISLLEENLDVTKREVAAGAVRVTTQTDSREEIAELALDRTGVEVTRVPSDRPIDQIPAVRTEGDLTIVPIVEERLVVTKQLVLVEELHVRRHTEQTIVREPVVLRRQRALIERLDAEGKPVPSKQAP